QFLVCSSLRDSRHKGSLVQRCPEFLNLSSEHVIARNPSGKQRRCQRSKCGKKAITICVKCDVGICASCFVDLHKKINNFFFITKSCFYAYLHYYAVVLYTGQLISAKLYTIFF